MLIILGPEVKDLSTEFVKDILSGKKALLKLSSVLFVKNVPFWEEFTARNVWNSIKNDRRTNKYFKNYNKSLPSRDYLLNVVNTANRNSVANAVNTVRQ